MSSVERERGQGSVFISCLTILKKTYKIKWFACLLIDYNWLLSPSYTHNMSDIDETTLESLNVSYGTGMETFAKKPK